MILLSRLVRTTGVLAVAATAVTAGTAVTAAASAGRPGRGGSLPRSAADTTGDTLDLVLAATTDVHGHLRGWDYFAARPDSANALARAATVVDSLRRVHPGRVVLVDAGDMLQGTPLTYRAARLDTLAPHPVPAAMNAMGYDAAAVGNHEFNYGLALVDRVRREARFPLLAANATRLDGARAFPAYTIVERGGARVAIVGATTPGSMVWDRDHLRGRLTIGDPVRAVRLAADSARAAGADVVVAVLHAGLDEPSSYDTAGTGGGPPLPSENVAGRVALEVPGVDAVVFGHSHRRLADTAATGVVRLQPKNWAAEVGVAHLTLVRDAQARGTPGRWRVLARRAELVPTRGHPEHPAVMAATEAAHVRAVAYVASALGTTPVAWRADSARVADAAITDFVLEVMRRRSGADLAATAAFSLDAGFDAGPITVAEVARLYPYENTLRTVRVTGAQLRAFLEQSARYFGTYDPATPAAGGVDPRVPGFNFDILAGADYVLDLSRPAGQRVTQLAVRGRPVADADTFSLALNNYRQTGGGGFVMLAGAPVVYDQGEEIRELLMDEVRQRGTLRPADYHTVNWRLAPPGAVAGAYAAMHRGRGAGGEATLMAAPTATRATSTAVPPNASAHTGRLPVRKAVVPASTPASSPADAAVRNARGATLPRRLRVLAINDFHGALEPRPDAQGALRGGAAPLAAAVARARTECVAPACVSVLLDGGDEFQGTPASNLAYGRPVVDYYRLLGVDAAALGNHEFDWGRDTLRVRAREAPYRILAANVRGPGGARLPGTADDTLVVRGGLRIGIVGLATPETPSTTRAANVRGLTFGPMAPAFDARARALRARGAHVVLAVAHSGAFCEQAPARPATVGGSRGDSAAVDVTAPGGCRGEIVDFANAITERADAVVSGHTHSRVDTRVRGTPVVQARSSGRALGVVDLVLDPATGAPLPDATRSEVREVEGSGDNAPAAARALVARATAAVADRVERRVAEIAVAMPRERDEQYALGNLIADAQRWGGRGDVAVTNNGGIRADLRAGTATYGTLFEIQPFGNVLSRVTVRGRDLRAYLERLVARERPRAHVSGVMVEYDPALAEGRRITGLRLADGSALDDDRLYTVVLNDFLVTGGDGLGLAGRAASVTPLNVVDLDALVGYLRQLPQPVRAPGEVRLRAVPAAAPTVAPNSSSNSAPSTVPSTAPTPPTGIAPDETA